MMTNKQIKLFKRFLKKHECYRNYIAYFGTNHVWRETHWSENATTSLSQYLQNINASDAINSAFNWHKTKEFSSYWLKLSFEWEDISNDM